MMLRRLVLLLVVLPLPALALGADWTRYVNPLFGAAADIPPGYAADGPASGAGDGKRFRAGNGRSAILVWGAPSGPGGFSDEMRARIASDEAEGWLLTYRSETPDWAAWGGTRAGHVFFAKTISTCDGRQTANVRLHYPAADVPGFDPIVTRLSRSLGQDGACF